MAFDLRTSNGGSSVLLYKQSLRKKETLIIVLWHIVDAQDLGAARRKERETRDIPSFFFQLVKQPPSAGMT